MKDFFKSIEKGLGQGVGLLLIFALAFGVYAFVEPSSGPSSDFYFNSESPIYTNTTSLQFMGLSAAVNGNRGGWLGAVDECDSLYPGSRPANPEDIVRLLGNNKINLTSEIWYFPEAMRSTGASCGQWSSSSGAVSGPVISTSGGQTTLACSSSRSFACVIGG